MAIEKERSILKIPETMNEKELIENIISVIYSRIDISDEDKAFMKIYIEKQKNNFKKEDLIKILEIFKTGETQFIQEKIFILKLLFETTKFGEELNRLTQEIPTVIQKNIATGSDNELSTSQLEAEKLLHKI